jgi:hypothetical protein
MNKSIRYSQSIGAKTFLSMYHKLFLPIAETRFPILRLVSASANGHKPTRLLGFVLHLLGLVREKIDDGTTVGTC